MVVCEEKPAFLQQDDLCAFFQKLEPTLQGIFFFQHRLPPVDYDGVRQDTFAKIYERLADTADPIHFSHARRYIINAFTNTCIKRYKKNRLRAHLLVDDLEEELPSAEQSPLELLLREERASLVRAAVSHLHEPYGSLVHLFYFEGLPYTKLIDHFGVSFTTIAWRLLHARRLLAKTLDSDVFHCN